MEIEEDDDMDEAQCDGATESSIVKNTACETVKESLQGGSPKTIGCCETDKES
jgi:hypothetical protein